MGKGDPPNLKDKDVKTKIDDWTVPIEVAGNKGAIAGTLTWVPLDEGGLPLAAIFAFAALLIVLSIAVFIIRRRRGDGRRRRRRRAAPAQKEVVEAW